ncbi:MAG: tail-specific protease [bacterium]|nr:tail-specific protease [bacterium]
MKKKILLITTCLLVVVLLSGFLFTKTIQKREEFLSRLIHFSLSNYHYSGKKADDDFSRKAFNEFLKALDYNKRYLLKEDINEFQKYKNSIDDQFISGSTELMQLVSDRLDSRLQQVMTFYGEILDKPFDFSIEENLELDTDKRDFCSSMTELKEYWRKVLKYRTMIRYIGLVNAEAKKKEKDSKEKDSKEKNKKDKKNIAKIKTEKKQIEKSLIAKKFNAKLEEKARKAVAKSLKNTLKRIRETNKKDALGFYLNSLVQVYDPHTTYFPPLEKETFDMQMSGSFEGIGAVLREEDGYVGVASIIPGGPSWKQKQLKAADNILKVAQGDEEPEDIVGMRVQDAVKLIRGKKGTLVNLTVQKPDKQILIIPIVRDVVIIEETFAKSVILNAENSKKKFGYIHLPRFYNDFNRRGGRNSTDDVKREVEKLKLKNVDGIILDLRNNGGGALTDAVNMSGLFIPEGPIVQVKDTKAEITPLSDPDPETIFDGPLVVMVNSLSASASEILAAALQDYGRAVIVGSSHSFGKGTVQVMLNLDRFLSEPAPDKETSLGAITVTIQKFYRINGKSIQQKGVTPDVVLPDRFASLEIGEKHLDYSLDWDTITSAKHDKWSTPLPDLSLLAEKSKNRLEKNKHFSVLKNYLAKLKQVRDDTLQNLHLNSELKRRDALKKDRDEYTKSQEETCKVAVSPSMKLKQNESPELYKIEKEREKEWFKLVEKDHYLEEALAIIEDMSENNPPPQGV